VILAFDSKFGPLKYASTRSTAGRTTCGRSRSRWRRSGRSTVTASRSAASSTRGWRAIPAKTGAPEDAISTTDDARRFLDEHGGSFVAAAKELHPDNGGNPGLFRAALRARELLGGAA
jgi:hypothetical protein